MNINEAIRMGTPGAYGDLDIWSPHPIRPQLGTPFKHSVPDSWSPKPTRSHMGNSFGYDLSVLSPRERLSPGTPGYDPESVSRNLFSGIYSSPLSGAQERLHRSSGDKGYDSSARNSPCRGGHSRCPHTPEVASLRKKDGTPNPQYEKSSNQLAVPGKNIIDLDRIARGLDTRTTVCPLIPH